MATIKRVAVPQMLPPAMTFRLRGNLTVVHPPYCHVLHGACRKSLNLAGEKAGHYIYSTFATSNSRTSTKWPAIAAAAAITGLTR
jgi:hypothetical protein